MTIFGRSKSVKSSPTKSPPESPARRSVHLPFRQSSDHSTDQDALRAQASSPTPSVASARSTRSTRSVASTASASAARLSYNHQGCIGNRYQSSSQLNTTNTPEPYVPRPFVRSVRSAPAVPTYTSTIKVPEVPSIPEHYKQPDSPKSATPSESADPPQGPVKRAASYQEQPALKTSLSSSSIAPPHQKYQVKRSSPLSQVFSFHQNPDDKSIPQHTRSKSLSPQLPNFPDESGLRRSRSKSLSSRTREVADDSISVHSNDDDAAGDLDVVVSPKIGLGLSNLITDSSGQSSVPKVVTSDASQLPPTESEQPPNQQSPAAEAVVYSQKLGTIETPDKTWTDILVVAPVPQLERNEHEPAGYTAAAEVSSPQQDLIQTVVRQSSTTDENKISRSVEYSSEMQDDRSDNRRRLPKVITQSVFHDIRITISPSTPSPHPLPETVPVSSVRGRSSSLASSRRPRNVANDFPTQHHHLVTTPDTSAVTEEISDRINVRGRPEVTSASTPEAVIDTAATKDVEIHNAQVSELWDEVPSAPQDVPYSTNTQYAQDQAPEVFVEPRSDVVRPLPVANHSTTNDLETNAFLQSHSPKEERSTSSFITNVLPEQIAEIQHPQPVPKLDLPEDSTLPRPRTAESSLIELGSVSRVLRRNQSTDSFASTLCTPPSVVMDKNESQLLTKPTFRGRNTSGAVPSPQVSVPGKVEQPKYTKSRVPKLDFSVPLSIADLAAEPREKHIQAPRFDIKDEDFLFSSIPTNVPAAPRSQAEQATKRRVRKEDISLPLRTVHVATGRNKTSEDAVLDQPRRRTFFPNRQKFNVDLEPQDRSSVSPKAENLSKGRPTSALAVLHRPNTPDKRKQSAVSLFRQKTEGVLPDKENVALSLPQTTGPDTNKRLIRDLEIPSAQLPLPNSTSSRRFHLPATVPPVASEPAPPSEKPAFGARKSSMQQPIVIKQVGHDSETTQQVSVSQGEVPLTATDPTQQADEDRVQTQPSANVIQPLKIRKHHKDAEPSPKYINTSFDHASEHTTKITDRDGSSNSAIGTTDTTCLVAKSPKAFTSLMTSSANNLAFGQIWQTDSDYSPPNTPLLTHSDRSTSPSLRLPFQIPDTVVASSGEANHSENEVDDCDDHQLDLLTLPMQSSEPQYSREDRDSFTLPIQRPDSPVLDELRSASFNLHSNVNSVITSPSEARRSLSFSHMPDRTATELIVSKKWTNHQDLTLPTITVMPTQSHYHSRTSSMSPPRVQLNKSLPETNDYVQRFYEEGSVRDSECRLVEDSTRMSYSPRKFCYPKSGNPRMSDISNDATDSPTSEPSSRLSSALTTPESNEHIRTSFIPDIDYATIATRGFSHTGFDFPFHIPSSIEAVYSKPHGSPTKLDTSTTQITKLAAPRKRRVATRNGDESRRLGMYIPPSSAFPLMAHDVALQRPNRVISIQLDEVSFDDFLTASFGSQNDLSLQNF